MRSIIRLLVLSIIVIATWFMLYRDEGNNPLPEESKTSEATSVVKKEVVSKSEESLEGKKSFILDVPYVSEAPEGNWSGDWINACEEAVIAMVEKYYEGKKTVSIVEAKNVLQKLFDEQNKLYGDNKNADASQIEEIVSLHSSFKPTIKRNPTLDEIKNEILNGRPVISLHRGFDLKNPNIPFSPTKSSYHTLVLFGFDDLKQEFITHDPGDDVSGDGHRYSYEIIMNSLHDYNRETDQTDGLPTVIFTE
jgi:uncharacterized protein YvpB